MEASLPDLYRVQEETRRCCEAVIKRVNFATFVGRLRDEADTDVGPVVTLLVRSVPDHGAPAEPVRDEPQTALEELAAIRQAREDEHDAAGPPSRAPRHWLDSVDESEPTSASGAAEADVYIDAHYGRPDELVVHTSVGSAFEAEAFAAALQAAAFRCAVDVATRAAEEDGEGDADDCVEIVDTLAGWQDVLREISQH